MGFYVDCVCWYCVLNWCTWCLRGLNFFACWGWYNTGGFVGFGVCDSGFFLGFGRVPCGYVVDCKVSRVS